ncbi:putative transferase, protein kinase RLK-Pelle-WAK-LRK10L-1 family [Medicago truncatula]|uniref:Putative transferase, protein kinase RLK-Pelle-WAK-LRK10L-1 family n=1 Tax=Medicago truncatula TaxID=3880 RepID=G7IC81_MEDTR|nr:wall associated kinase-like protein [Medicago truncatula]RHN82391.1 putative transferase, protein kinase RLK-Pelle-WAK-LRK10L-1 family [Medicago truncatula]
MALVYVLHFRFLLFSHLTVLLLLVLTRKGNGHSGDCPDSFGCGNLGFFKYPFTTVEFPSCGALAIQGCDNLNKTAMKYVQLTKRGKLFQVKKIDNHWSIGNTISIIDPNITKLLEKNACEAFSYVNITLPPPTPFGTFFMKNYITAFKCNHTRKLGIHPPSNFFINSSCHPYDFYFGDSIFDDESNHSFVSCSSLHLPVNELGFALSGNPFPFLTNEITFQFQSSYDCQQCHNHYHDKKNHCHVDSNGQIYCVARKGRSPARKLGLVLGVGVGPWIIVGLFLALRHYKRKSGPAQTQSQPSNNTYVDPYLNREVESTKLFFGVPVFSYEELQQATNNFDRRRKLGVGGFGSVYHGKLKDGREVAVKHLFEQNYRRVEQFVNEIEVLARLRHRNLVSLYGCTSRHSRELLLVYEYVPNGTVASHLHGDLARAGLLTWLIRMQIAIETASALAYLHASDIIHRDVKTTNILLDINFSVKLADFGLSRLFPSDVSHVSTAPQGSPGYLDPEYFQLYKLSEKSDVYSFGVVLIELISSMTVIDSAREREEVNLANLAAKKIRNGAVGELVDPSLGFESDSEVNRMVTSVAELAFQCVLGDMELRPSMDEVLQELKKIDGGNFEFDHLEKVHDSVGSSRYEEVHSPIVGTSIYRKQEVSTSPKSLTEKWESESITPNVSG